MRFETSDSVAFIYFILNIPLEPKVWDENGIIPFGGI